MRLNYDEIKRLAKEEGVKVSDLIALAPANDPFYCGQEAQRAAGEWFARLWKRFGYTSGVHIRRVHYQMVSAGVTRPDGTPYENTEQAWGYLVAASKAARYLELVDPAAFVDRRNPDPHLHTSYWGQTEPGVYLRGEYHELEISLPGFPDLPRLEAEGYDQGPLQRYLVECWAEKSTMNDVLLPLGRDYGVNVVTGAGELSITAALAFVQRAQRANRPARILYISDFDPAGLGMPISVARKIEYFLASQGLDLDIRLEPLALTAQQCRQYRLPRTPIKETEKRRGKFEAAFGEGATELDALEALHPGELKRIVEAAILRFYDPEISDRAREARREYQELLDERADAAVDDLLEEITDLRAEFEAVTARYAEALERLQPRLQSLQRDMVARLAEVKDQVENEDNPCPCPEAREGDESSSPLYDSTRRYMEQLGYYKAQRVGENEEV